MGEVFFTIMPDKIKIGIIGGGRAAYIKAKAIIKNKGEVTILSTEFCEEILHLGKNGAKLIKGKYYKEFIIDKHIIIIAVPPKEGTMIKKHCQEQCKLFIYCPEYKDVNIVFPAQGNTDSTIFALRTKGANPSLAKMLKGKVATTLKEYDEFIEFLQPIRERAKSLGKNKDEILEFLSTEDYKFMWKKGFGTIILNMFYSEEVVKILVSKKF